MGCTSSTVDPNFMYGSEHKNVVRGTHETSALNYSNINAQVATVKPLRGDFGLYSEAKARRERKLRDILLNREILAKEMSDHVIEEKERLSLTSSRSRATSPRSSRHIQAGGDNSPPLSGCSKATARSVKDIGLSSSSTVTFATYSDAPRAVKQGGSRDSDNAKDSQDTTVIAENTHRKKFNKNMNHSGNLQNGGSHVISVICEQPEDGVNKSIVNIT